MINGEKKILNALYCMKLLYRGIDDSLFKKSRINWTPYIAGAIFV